jgi:hypothetical protein
MRSYSHAHLQPDPALPAGERAPGLNLLEGDLLENAEEITARFQAQVQLEIAGHLAAGHPIFFGGVANQAGKLYMRTPDGKVHEILRIGADLGAFLIEGDQGN